jgi:hypothetical protein
MLALLFFVCLAVLILFNPTTEEQEEISPAANQTAWLLAVVAFVILLGAVSIAGAGIAALAVQP